PYATRFRSLAGVARVVQREIEDDFVHLGSRRGGEGKACQAGMENVAQHLFSFLIWSAAPPTMAGRDPYPEYRPWTGRVAEVLMKIATFVLHRAPSRGRIER